MTPILETNHTLTQSHSQESLLRPTCNRSTATVKHAATYHRLSVVDTHKKAHMRPSMVLKRVGTTFEESIKLRTDYLPTDVTGSASAKKAIFVIYDVFGFFEQTIQGADILAQGAKGEGYQVFMPDFFDGNPADIAWYVFIPFSNSLPIFFT
jgi:hypothetical protein